MKIIRTGGKWKPDDWPIYFAASNVKTLVTGEALLHHILIAVNEIAESATALEALARFIKSRKTVLIDSGVYWLSTQHAKRHDLSMDVALSLSPEEVDDFDKLFATYVRIVKEYGDRCWGYIEIDQGGRENKLKTRAKLEKMGLRPIPVYHPLNDGWDYFDYLAKRYDRICFGNVVMADAFMRKRLIATAWERRRQYPHLWIHALGMTPSEITTAYPMNSCDSSTWMRGPRWGKHDALIANTHGSSIDDRFIYSREEERDHERGWSKAVRMCSYDTVMMNRIMKTMADEAEKKLGADIGLFDG